MALNLKDLVVLALLDSVVDRPVSLKTIVEAGAHWHELNGRSDVREIIAQSMHQLLEEGALHVHEDNGKTVLVGAEAVMVVQKAKANPEQFETVQIETTDSGKALYKKLAHTYYNQ